MLGGGIMRGKGFYFLLTMLLLLTASTVFVFQTFSGKDFPVKSQAGEQKDALYRLDGKIVSQQARIKGLETLAEDVTTLSKRLVDMSIEGDNGPRGTPKSGIGRSDEDSNTGEEEVQYTKTRAQSDGVQVVDKVVPFDVSVQDENEEMGNKRDAVREAMKHAWKGYVQYAWGYDELEPMSRRGKNLFGKLGATIVDAIDTLYLMGLTEQFQAALAYIQQDMHVDRGGDVSVFETTIRSIGGLLATHDLSGEDGLVQKANDIAQRLLPAFNTPSGLPYGIVNLQTQKTHNPSWSSKSSILSEFGSEQLEFFTLARKTGQWMYKDLTEKPLQVMHQKKSYGLTPIFWDSISGEPGKSKQVSFGALGDSYYEYLLKIWILTGKQNEKYRSLWELSMDEMIDQLVFHAKSTGLTYVAMLTRKGTLLHRFEHLACFIPGMLALGVYQEAVKGGKADKYLQLAKDLTETCHYMYHSTPTGLSPEYISFDTSGNVNIDNRNAYYILRPEAVESFFLLWRITGDRKYREYGWRVFQALQKHCKQDVGYAGVKDVQVMPVVTDDTMQSFFLAETLKYLYLLFSPAETISLKEWVFNTEAHPLRIPPLEAWNQHLVQ